METLLVKFVTPWLVPPGANLAVLLAALLCWRRARRTARVLALVAIATLYLASTWEVVGVLRAGLEVHPPLAPGTLADTGAGAIVVLGGGRYPHGPEFGGETVSPDTFARLRYAARLQRETGLPVLVTGGSVYGESRSEGALMREAAERELGMSVRWVEAASRNTAENARGSAALLRTDGIEHVALVTHATHMRRAVSVFEASGLRVTPAPTLLDTDGDGAYPLASGLLPSASALHIAAACVHEYLGLAWYAIRY